MYILVLDIGGTHPRLAMMDVADANSSVIVHQQDIEYDVQELVPVINDFLGECGNRGYTTHICCAAVAGPVDTQKNECRNPTNAKFPVIGKEIQDNTLLEHVLVINDFDAIGEAVATIDLGKGSDNVIALNNSATHTPKENRAVLGAGTGLGIAYAHYDNDHYYVSASEGGHAGFPVRGNYEDLYTFMKKKLNITQLGTESLVSGHGIEHIMDYFLQYQFAFKDLLQREEFKDVATIEESFTDRMFLDAYEQAKQDESVDIAALISQHTDHNPKAQLSVRVFMEFLGAAAQSVALHGLSKGGLFIAGGIVGKNIDVLEKGDLMRAFLDNWKPNIAQLLKTIPVYVLTDYNISFYGAARAAYMSFCEDSIDRANT